MEVSKGGLKLMVQLLLGCDQEVFMKDRWSLNAGGDKDKLHCTLSKL